jgi:hypothetical protein
MTELGPNLAGPPPRTGQPASYPSGDTRLAPHSGPSGMRRADPLRATKTTKRLDPHDPAPRRKFPRRKSPSPPFGSPLWMSLSALWGERACPGRDPGSGVRWGLPQTDSPAPLTLPSPPGQRQARVKAASSAPNAAATTPAPRFREADAHRAGITTHPEN